MRRKVLTILCIMALLLGALGVSAAADLTDPAALIGETPYETLEKAVEAVKNGEQDGLIVLKKSVDSVTIDCDVYVDLNGKDITSLTVNNGTFYGMDSQTDDFEIDAVNHTGYGKIGEIKGNTANVKGVSVDDGYTCDGYLMVKEDGYGTSFHCVNLRLTAMTLKPKSIEGDSQYAPGVYYKSNFGGDALVAAKVARFGIAMSVIEAPGVSNLEDACMLSEFTGFVAGYNTTNTSTLLQGVMKEENPKLANRRNSQIPVYGRAYVQLVDGSYIFGATQSRSLKDQAEAANQIWARFEKAEQEELVALYETFETIMKTWDLPGMQLAPYSYVVDDPYTWYEEFQELAIANADMSKAELRQLCVDFFRLQLSFQWTSNADFTFTDGGRTTTITPDIAFKGMVYANDGSVVDGVSYGAGSGNVYKVLNYYDKATGILDLEAIREDGGDKAVLDMLTSHCNYGAGWGWNRVSNANYLWGCAQYLPSHGAIPVGVYEWNEPAYYSENEDGSVADYGNNTEDIIEANATGIWIFKDYQAIFKSYAVMQKADGLWSSPGWHVLMCSDEPVIAYKSNGNIDPDNSYIYVIDQNATESTDRYYWDSSLNLMKTNEDGYYLRNLGGIPDVNQDPSSPHYGKVGTPRSFQDLLDSDYVPFTIPELVDLESTEKDINGETELDNWNQYVLNISSYREAYQSNYDAAAAAVAADPADTVSDAKKRFYGDALKMIDRCVSSPSDVVAVESGSASVAFAADIKPSGGKVTLDALCDPRTTIRANYVMSNFLVTIENAQGETLYEDAPPVFTRNRSTSITDLSPTDKVSILNKTELSEYVGAGNSITISVQLSTGEWIDAFTAELVQ